MKFNEPVRPAGIGRKQVAFDVGRKPTALTLIESEDNSSLDPQSNEAQNIATLAQAGAHARAIAYSAANATASKNQNDIWGLHKILPWTHVISFPYGNSSSYIHWDGYDSAGYGYSDINSSLAYVDGEDPTIIRVTRSGWYLVTVHLFQGAEAIADHINRLTILSVDSTDTYVPFVTYESKGYPSLTITAMMPVPGYLEDGNSSLDYDIFDKKGGFKVEYRIQGNHQQSIDITPSNSSAYIQIAWMRPWEEGFKVNFA